MIGWVCGPMRSSIPSTDPLVPGPPDADDAPVLDPDVGLDGTDDRVEHERAGDDDVQLGIARPALGRARSKRLGVAPDRLVAGSLAVVFDADPQVGVTEADAIAGGRTVAGEALGGGEALHRRPHQVDGPRLARPPALGRARREVEPEAGRSPRSNSRRWLTRSNG